MQNIFCGDLTNRSKCMRMYFESLESTIGIQGAPAPALFFSPSAPQFQTHVLKRTTSNVNRCWLINWRVPQMATAKAKQPRGVNVSAGLTSFSSVTSYSEQVSIFRRFHVELLQENLFLGTKLLAFSPQTITIYQALGATKNVQQTHKQHISSIKDHKGIVQILRQIELIVLLCKPPG